MSDPYAQFADRYDLFFSLEGEGGRSARTGFFRELFAERGVRSVLDCACGTGHDLAMFSELGCQVVGADLSPSMLAKARENLAAGGLDVPLTLADYRDLPTHFSQPFDAVVCLSSSLLHMPDEEQAVRALRSMRAVLREGGILVLTQGTSDSQWAERPRFIPAVNRPDVSRLFVIDYHDPGATYHILDLFHEPDRASFHHWSVRYEHVWLRNDQERLLRGAGFADLAFYGDWDMQPYDVATSGRLIAVATK